MKAFITGINGFAGSFLAEALLKSGRQVTGSVQPGTPLDNLAAIEAQLKLIPLDLNDSSALEKFIAAEAPDEIYHLAAVSSVKDSLDDPRKCFIVNVLGSLNLLEAARHHLPKTTVVLVTSSEIYGEALSEKVLTSESSPIIPKSPYAVSKAALDHLGRVYANNFGLKVVIARPFSHIGPRQTSVFFIPSIASQIVELEKTGGGEIKVGNIEMDRDFTDVRDVVEAYVLLAEKGKSGEAYNICRGETRRLKELVDRLIALARVPIKVTIDSERCRPSDLTSMKIDSRKLKAIGWQPIIPIDTTLADILAYWRKRV
ncbi:MAG: GDP-mannose 4,6-dehydratase [Candidatus Margulisbacteria bacterium]|nr:GDP-mannose 4,6-dehydratase [Candidatus Margulisiibacteriota bacterium]